MSNKISKRNKAKKINESVQKNEVKQNKQGNEAEEQQVNENSVNDKNKSTENIKENNENKNSENIEENNEAKKQSKNKKANLKLSKPMKKYTFLMVFISIITSIIFVLIIYSPVKSNLKYISEYEDQKNYYENELYDFIVNNPSENQINGFENNKYVLTSTAVSKKEYYSKVGQKTDYYNYFITSSLDELEKTDFCENRIIESKSLNGKYAFVDYRFCQINNVKLGDKITIVVKGKNIPLEIARVYRTNYSYLEGVIATTFAVLENTNPSYSCIYLKASNKDKFLDELKQYKPLGTLLEKKDDQSQEDYDNYLKEFYAKDYSSFVINNDNQATKIKENYLSKIDSSNTNKLVFIIIEGVVIFLLSIFVFMINAKNKKDKIYKYINANGKNGKKNLYKIYGAFYLMLFVLLIGFNLIMLKKAQLSLSCYYKYSQILMNNVLLLIISALCVFIPSIFIMLKIKKA